MSFSCGKPHHGKRTGRRSVVREGKGEQLMLVVRRRLGELIRIGEDVQLRLLSIGKTSVRLGIEAPRSIPIDMRQSPAESAEKTFAAGRYGETSEEG